MNRVLQITADGSHTIAVPEQRVTYHSRYGAIQESRHVYIDAGLKYVLSHSDISPDQPLNIFEMGFGTGLNALLTLQEALHCRRKIFYQAVELFPLEENEWRKLNYTKILNDYSPEQYFLNMHQCAWEEDVLIDPFFILHKSGTSLLNFKTQQLFDLVFFDAFDPEAEPGLWSREVFDKIFYLLNNQGVLVTYCSKGNVRRAMVATGFSIEKIPGPPGKREMLRARKILDL